jgi:hypothetical protein
MNGEARSSGSMNTVGEPTEAAGEVDPSLAMEVPPVAQTENLAMETLNRYLEVAAEDREAAEERSSKVVARFTKLTIAMMCLTTVIAVANVAMIIRQSSTTPPATVASPHRIELPPVLAQPAQPILPPPPVSHDVVLPAEKILLLGSLPGEKKSPLLGSLPVEKKSPLLGSLPVEKKSPLLGSPPSTKVTLSPTPGLPRVARVATTKPHPLPQPLLSASDEEEDDSKSSGPVERW